MKCEAVYVLLDIIFDHTMLIKKSFFFTIRFFYAVFSFFGLLNYFSFERLHSALANVKQTIYSSVYEQFILLLEKRKIQ